MLQAKELGIPLRSGVDVKVWCTILGDSGGFCMGIVYSLLCVWSLQKLPTLETFYLALQVSV
jgi:hypothetical protein